MIIRGITFLSLALLAIALHVNMAFAAPSQCTSANASGTPAGSECKCSASGRGSNCQNIANFVWCWNADGDAEACYWEKGKGCVCVYTPSGKNKMYRSLDELLGFEDGSPQSLE
ncbi:MAG: hypothetical protein K1X79_10245 [Oligoflexia bacterium]|nr:hypothetical protein [Oligoflexia bacterium]